MKMTILVVLLLAATAEARVLDRVEPPFIAVTTTTIPTVNTSVKSWDSGFVREYAKEESALPAWVEEVIPPQLSGLSLPKIDFGLYLPLGMIALVGLMGVFTLGKTIKYVEAKLSYGGGRVLR